MAGVPRPLHICAFVVATASRDENGRERSGKPFNHSRNHIFFVGNGNAGREYETDITGYRERNNSIGNKPVTIGNRKLKTETPPHVTISNI